MTLERLRRIKALAFWVGCLAVTAGVILHLPMFLMAKDMGWRLAGMARSLSVTTTAAPHARAISAMWAS